MSLQGERAISLVFNILWIAVVTVQGKLGESNCEVTSDVDATTNACYIKEVLVSMAHSPNQLAVDKSSNNLYFSFDFGQGEYVPAVLRIDTKKVTILKGIKDAFALSFDSVTKEMYFGGSHGIYRYNTVRKILKRLNINNLDIWWLFVKKHIYFIKFPSLTAFCYQNRTIKYVNELRNIVVHQFVFDADDNIFFINSSGLFGVNGTSGETTLLRDIPKFVGMAVDNRGLLHVCSDDGIYIVSQVVRKVKRIAKVHGVLGLTFDKHNNIIYSDSHELVRLLPVNDSNVNNI